MRIQEGYIDFKNYKTYYRITNPQAKKYPLLFLHGGPGSTHNYFEVFDEIAEELDRPLVMYDQIGCGKSSMDLDSSNFNQEFWTQELENLREKLKLENIHILGQSWGGMLALSYCIDKKPIGLESLILSSTLSSAKLWKEEQYRRISYMEKEKQEIIKKAEENDDYDNPLYKEVVDEFMEKYCASSPKESDPECLRRNKNAGRIAYIKAWGQNEFMPTGTLSDFDYTDKLSEIKVPSLITSGSMDLSSPYISKILFDNIENSKWELFQYSRHMPFIDERKKYLKVLIAWLDNFK